MTDKPLHRASSYQIWICPDPGCGPHIRVYDVAGVCLCEMVIPLSHVSTFVGELLAFTGEKNAKPGGTLQ